MSIKIIGDPINEAHFAFDGTIAVSFGDLMFYDTNDVKPFSSMADQLTLALNQAMGSRLFAGIARDARGVGDVQALTDFPILTDVLAEIDCSSSTFEIGDLVAPVENGGGTALLNSTVVKTTDSGLAIGRVTKRYSGATTKVQCRLTSRVMPPGGGVTSGLVGGGYFQLSQSLHATKTAWVIGQTQEAITIVGIDYIPDIAQGGAATATVVKCTSTNAPVAATTPMMTGSFDANATANTLQSATLTSTVADLALLPGERVGVKFSTAPTVGSGLFTVRYRRT